LRDVVKISPRATVDMSGRQVSGRLSVECLIASSEMNSYFLNRLVNSMSRYSTGKSRAHSGVPVSVRTPATHTASPYFVETAG
jgi:hypothetical protein